MAARGWIQRGVLLALADGSALSPAQLALKLPDNPSVDAVRNALKALRDAGRVYGTQALGERSGNLVWRRGVDPAGAPAPPPPSPPPPPPPLRMHYIITALYRSS